MNIRKYHTLELAKRHLLISISALAVMLVLLAYLILLKPGTTQEYQTVPLRRGDLNVSISATGTIEPEEVIDVGAQIAGQIKSFGTDLAGKPIDYRSQVAEGTILASIDDILYNAGLLQAQAQMKHANADVLQMQAKLLQAELDWKRAQKLGPAALSQSAYDGYRAGYETAKANVAVADSEVAQAEAQIIQAERNLSYCTIRSPVNGIVIDRRVNIGQTVVASLNAPSLFLIAKDLTRMQVWVSVNEADIGRIHPGQKVSFTVDAFPSEQFLGEVIKIRLNASISQNVVAYVVEVATDNKSGRLLPYLTANVQFIVTNRKDVWLVPNSALRWKPDGATANFPPGEKAIWIETNGDIKPIKVTVVESDGAQSEISSDQLQSDMAVIIGASKSNKESAGASESVNPFAPNIHRGGKRGG